jgi:hypothetical protein
MSSITPDFWARRPVISINWSRVQTVCLILLVLLVPLSFKQSTYRRATPQPTMNPATPAPAGPPSPLVVAAVQPADVEDPGALRLRAVPVTVPTDPFRETLPERPQAREPVRGPVGALGGGRAMGLRWRGGMLPPAAGPWGGAPGWVPPAGAVPAGPPAAAPAPLVKQEPHELAPEDVTLTGTIQGDPPLAVIKYGGQSLFLKIGDQVADAWRLAEIGERSAVLKRGEQRIEVHITRGGSQ